MRNKKRNETMTLTLTKPENSTRWHSVADLVASLGGIPAERVQMSPWPGTATEEDALHANDHQAQRSCELIAGVLVEKAAISFLEDIYATVLIYHPQVYLRAHRIGKAATAGACYRMKSGNVRLPDVSVCLNDKFPTGKVERLPIANFAPDLAVEVLSQHNTKREIEEKCSEYFASGTQLVWIVDPAKRVVIVKTSIDERFELTEADILDGGTILPGFQLSIRDWFHEAETV